MKEIKKKDATIRTHTTYARTHARARPNAYNGRGIRGAFVIMCLLAIQQNGCTLFIQQTLCSSLLWFFCSVARDDCICVDVNSNTITDFSENQIAIAALSEPQFPQLYYDCNCDCYYY